MSLQARLAFVHCTILLLLLIGIAIVETDASPLKLRRQKLKFGRMFTRTINNAMYGFFDIFAG
uniref:Uncharacterized protein n=1 Tax=Anopheles funestus TaxID=62324 RepID=A0A182S3A4_ANOFN